MTTRGVICAFAVICGVEASLIVPQVSSAQQLAETMTATAINGQLHSNQSSGIGAVQKARNLRGTANSMRMYENDALGDGQTQHTGDLQNGKPRSGVDAANVAQFDDKNPVKGKTYATDGIVIFDGMLSGQRVIMLVRVDGPNKFQVLGFRPHDQAVPVLAKNTPVRVTAVYAAKFREPKTGSMVHGFDNAVFETGPAPAGAGAASPNAAAAKEEKPTFNSIMKGWAFRGTVYVEGKATAVFVNDSKVKYAQVGTLLDEGVRVASVGNGKARVLIDGNRFDVTPW